MANLFPANFDLSELEDAEREVAEAFLTQLDDSWYVVPSIPIVYQGNDYEIDIALVSHDHGLYLVEVKGGVITKSGDKWKSYSTIIKNPFEQITKAKHGLLKRLKQNKVSLEGVFVQHLVAFPHIGSFPDEGGGPEAPREIVLTSVELQWPEKVLAHLRQSANVISPERVAALLKALKPDITNIDVHGQFVTGASQRIDRASINELRLLFELDENKRIYLRGRAGTGKTFLAHHWTKRALRRGERTLLVCFNRALGSELQQSFDEFVSTLEPSPLFRAGSFHALANALLGEHSLAVPTPTPERFWDEAHAKALLENLHNIEERFDTIIIDEGQDFEPLWYEALQSLLADKEKGRFYVTFDEEQAIFAAPPDIPKNAVLFRLHHNVRSTRNIGVVAKQLGGAAVHKHSPPGPKVDVFAVGGKKERSKKIIQSLKKITEELEIPLSQILVLVPHNQDIAELTAEPLGEFTLAPWHKRDEDTVTCATIHGTKGLERLAVIVASMDDDVDPQVTYVGLTRASVYLSVIGSEKFIASISPKQPQTK